MSQHTVFKCDECGKEIGPKKHLSLFIQPGSGVALPPTKTKSRWTVKNFNGFVHFCGGKCISEFMEALIEGAEEKD